MSLGRHRLCPALAVVLAIAGCGVTEPVPTFDETPAISLLITPGAYPPSLRVAQDSGLSAALVSTGTPLRSPYLRAERFEMRRASDGAPFAWHPVDPGSGVVGIFPATAGNYFLPRQQNTAGLGSDSILVREVYELLVEVDGYRIVGRTRVPGPVEFARSPADGDSVVRWKRVPGAASYQLWAGFAVLTPTPITDTALIYPRRLRSTGPSDPVAVRVFALDSNYAALLGDVRASRAGITGGWGVFGSFTWGETELPVSPSRSPSP